MTTITTLGVTGMTCSNCVEHVTSELEQVDGVEKVLVTLKQDEPSEVVVTSDAPLEEPAVRAAIDEAGYAVAAIEVQVDGERAQWSEQGEAGRS
ncbi:hypothetical protein GCM10025865_27340 [Paraoerskovia sediminicola]|uniref:HMA domain-containing protein n=1 Tax=Paraoerskovia sediminicola TaxID=1138587 RepID=A0ABN6XFE2_9CELL|nr:heavy metal-associated domain-containing protein [Paraoerskovia sediminicola]BDZ43435.1 hypothetical protein GCM10025865_27340 [Paraoerskovia sediminicola]